MQNDGYKKPAYLDDVAQFFSLLLRPLEPGSKKSATNIPTAINCGLKSIVRIPGWNVKKILTVQYTNKHPVINCSPKLPRVSCLILHYISSCLRVLSYGL